MTWRFLFGIIILILAGGFMLDQAQLVPGFHFVMVLAMWWPAVIIAIAVNQLVRHMENPWGSLIITGVGITLLMWTQDRLTMMGKTWPFFLAIAMLLCGIRLILPRRVRRSQSDVIQRSTGKAKRFNQLVREMQLFHEIHYRNESQQFKGGIISSVFSEYEIDLRGALVSREGADLNVQAIFGTVFVRVPEQMTVKVTGIPVLGSIDKDAKQIVPPDAGQPVLRLRCTAVFGAVQITN